MKHCEIRFGGSGGQGLILAGNIVASACKLAGMKVAQSQSYEPTSRGGLSRSDLVIEQDTVDYPLATALDLLLVLDPIAIGPSLELLSEKSVVVVDSEKVAVPPGGPFTLHSLPLVETALELGNVRVANIVAIGALLGLSDIVPHAALEQAVRSHAPKGFLQLNVEALHRGLGFAAGIRGRRGPCRYRRNDRRG